MIDSVKTINSDNSSPISSSLSTRFSNLMTAQKSRERYLQKEQQVLQFLRDETFSTTRILSRVMELTTLSATHHSLSRMQKHGVIQKASVSLLEDAKITLWVITEHGLGLSYGDIQNEPYLERAAFDSSSVPTGRLSHTLDIQKIRVAAEKLGWRNWAKGDHVVREKQQRIPDATANDPEGRKVAIEIERTLKSPKRYAEIIGDYLSLMNQNAYDRVYYFCPNSRVQTALTNIIHNLKQVYYEGHWGAVDPSYFVNFQFLNYEKWR